MKCKNCQSEMEIMNGNYQWCSECGMFLVITKSFEYTDATFTEGGIKNEHWFEPKSVANTKKLVSALIKANDRASSHISTINRMIEDQREEIGYDDSRDR